MLSESYSAPAAERRSRCHRAHIDDRRHAAHRGRRRALAGRDRHAERDQLGATLAAAANRTRSCARTGHRALFVVHQLAAGVGVASFTAQLETVAGERAAAYPENDTPGIGGVETLAGYAGGSTKAVSAAVLAVRRRALALLVARANVAYLTLANAVMADGNDPPFARALARGPRSRTHSSRNRGVKTYDPPGLGAVTGSFSSERASGCSSSYASVRPIRARWRRPSYLWTECRSDSAIVLTAFVTTALVGLLPALQKLPVDGARARRLQVR